MKFMLDTNTCIYIIKQKPAEVQGHFKKHSLYYFRKPLTQIPENFILTHEETMGRKV